MGNLSGFMFKNYISKASKQRKFGFGLLILAILILLIFAGWYFAEKYHYFSDGSTTNNGYATMETSNI